MKKRMSGWAAVAALALLGPAAFGEEPVAPPAAQTQVNPPAVETQAAPPAAETHVAPVPAVGPHGVPVPPGSPELFVPGCAACSGCGGHPDGDTCQRIKDWILYRPILTPCGCGCGCGTCKQCDCLYPHTWQFFLCSGHGVVHAPPLPECACDCGGPCGGTGCGCGGHWLLSLFQSHP